jgi:hypothetical protein
MEYMDTVVNVSRPGRHGLPPAVKAHVDDVLTRYTQTRNAARMAAALRKETYVVDRRQCVAVLRAWSQWELELLDGCVAAGLAAVVKKWSPQPDSWTTFAVGHAAAATHQTSDLHTDGPDEDNLDQDDLIENLEHEEVDDAGQEEDEHVTRWVALHAAGVTATRFPRSTASAMNMSRVDLILYRPPPAANGPCRVVKWSIRCYAEALVRPTRLALVTATALGPMTRLDFYPPLVRWAASAHHSGDVYIDIDSLDGTALTRRVRLNKLPWASSLSRDVLDYADDNRNDFRVETFGFSNALILARATVLPGDDTSSRYPQERSELASLARWVSDIDLDLAARTIQRVWRKIISDPCYTVCRRRLLRS